MPLFSIITINYNNAGGLNKTIGSVIQQTFNDFEYIIIDGASADTSLEVIKSFTSIPPDIYQPSTTNHHSLISYWISEPDTGIYNAMNKGIAVASGKYLLFLNSGDTLNNSNVLSNSASTILNSTELFSGCLTLIEGGNKKVLTPPIELTLYQSVYSGLTHPNTFIKRTLFDKYGLYNENNKIVSDWEFFLVAGGLNVCNYQSTDLIISCFITDGISSNPNSKILVKETENVLNRLIPHNILSDLKHFRTLENKLNSDVHYIICYLSHYKYIYIIIKFVLKFLYFILKKTMNNRKC